MQWKGRLSGIGKNKISKEIATVLACEIKDAKLVFEQLINEGYLVFEKKKSEAPYIMKLLKQRKGAGLE